MTDEEKDAYLKLGMISTKFAEIEYYSELILSKIISRDDKLFALTIIKDFSLHKKLELIKNLNKVSLIQFEDINSFVETVKHIKFQRNQLIHGYLSL